VSVLLFDIDGTLLNAGGAGQVAMERVLFEDFGVSGPIHDIPAAGRTDRAITEDLLRFYGLPINEEVWDRFLTRYFSRLPAGLGCTSGLVLPGVRSLLDQLQQDERLELGLLTGNFAEGARLKLQHFGLGDYFSGGAYGDAHLERNDVAREAWGLVKSWRPHVQPRDVWVIGDTPSDIACGKAIGARTVAVATGIFSIADLAPHQPDYLIASLEDREWLDEVE
jgi:phosphoglycolate phosphatase